ncbi:HAMP domain-containing sensor histidine kinase [Sphaerisporangium sp. B11E5]|uniref:sensor histidine kinase n=1 Tax=Sphaerisporangium sp. B11E5 TaxID=3153563 RepID=UPI00325D2391
MSTVTAWRETPEASRAVRNTSDGAAPGRSEQGRQACTLDEERRQFASDAAHRLRTPLAGLRAELEEAGLHPGETDLYDLVKRTLRAVDRLEEAVAELGGIGEVSRADERERVDLGRLAREETARRPDRGMVRLALVPGVAADACHAELRRVFTVLLDGARDRSEGMVLVEVRRDGPAAVLMVTAGPPTAPARAFTRLDTAGGGGRLGLSVAHAFARVHDGRLDVHGTASFTLRLPAAPGR